MMAARIRLIAGDFGRAEARLHRVWGGPVLVIAQGLFRSVEIHLKRDLAKVERLTEEGVKDWLSAAGWGLVGAAVGGWPGFFAGALLGGRGRQVCFAAHLEDGRRFLAVADPGTFRRIQAAAF